MSFSDLVEGKNRAQRRVPSLNMPGRLVPLTLEGPKVGSRMTRKLPA